MKGKFCTHEYITIEHKAFVNIKGIAEKYKNKNLYKPITTHHNNKNIKKFALNLFNMCVWISTRCNWMLLAIYCYADKIEFYVKDSGI